MVALPQEKSQSRAAFGSAAHASPAGEVAEDQRPEGSTAWRSLALLPALPGAQGQLSQSLCPWEVGATGRIPGGQAAARSFTPEGHAKAPAS